MEERGYDVRRFQGEVRRDLLCSFCLNVPEDARLCQNHDHLFCFAHISQYLRRRKACPTCREPLTAQTLRRPIGFIRNYLDDLMINCEYNDRGCQEHVRLESLQNHVGQCGFAPVTCGNERCGMEINKSDKESHEKDLCLFRIVKYRDIKADQEEIMEKQDVFMQELSEVMASQDEIRNIQDVMKANQDEMKANQGGMIENQDEMKEGQKKVERRQDRMNKELQRVKEDISGIKRKQDEIDDRVKKMKENVDKIQQTQVDMFANMNRQFFEMLGVMNPVRTQATDREIVIVGGYEETVDKENLEPGSMKAVEIYNVRNGKSTNIPPMITPRGGPASCVYKNDVIIVGGENSQGGIDTIEVLKMDQFPRRWNIFGKKLPVKLSHSDLVVHQDKLIVIGGLNRSENSVSDAIYAVRLIPPYTSELLFTMPQPRQDHSAELVNGKLFILGGSTTCDSLGVTDSVIVYNFNNRDVEIHAALSKPLFAMSTVTCGNMIIVTGGRDGNNGALNEVFTYDTETGKSEPLPPMIHERRNCSAVIIDNEIFVMGGCDREERYLDSVECHKIGSDGWKKQAGMNAKRTCGAAVVKPHT